MGATVLEFTTQAVYACDCITCGVPVFMPSALKTQRLRDHSNFYCCNGHSQHWPGKSKEEQLREELEAEKAKRTEDVRRERLLRESAERSAAAARGQVTKIKNRVGNGVCPCCNRSFQNLQRHMHTKHPNFKSEES